MDSKQQEALQDVPSTSCTPAHPALMHCRTLYSTTVPRCSRLPPFTLLLALLAWPPTALPPPPPAVWLHPVGWKPTTAVYLPL